MDCSPLDQVRSNVQLNQASQPNSATEHLYLEAFPLEERRPLDDWRLKAANGEMTLYEISVADRFAGFISVWDLAEIAYVEHFAILPDMRGYGIGGEVIRRIIDIVAPKPLVLEVELPATGPEARRRVDFYTRNGMYPLEGFHYIQPSYAPGLDPIPMLLMASAEVDSATVVCRLRNRVYGVE